jgi:hypothetical protein
VVTKPVQDRGCQGLEGDLRTIIRDVIIRAVGDEEGSVWREAGEQAHHCLKKKSCNDRVRSPVIFDCLAHAGTT